MVKQFARDLRVAIPSEAIRPPAAVPRYHEDWDQAGAAAHVFWAGVGESAMTNNGHRPILCRFDRLSDDAMPILPMNFDYTTAQNRPSGPDSF